MTLSGVITFTSLLPPKNETLAYEGNIEARHFSYPESYVWGKELELHHEEFHYQDHLNVNETSNAASGTGTAFVFGGA